MGLIKRRVTVTHQGVTESVTAVNKKNVNGQTVYMSDADFRGEQERQKEGLKEKIEGVLRQRRTVRAVWEDPDVEGSYKSEELVLKQEMTDAQLDQLQQRIGANRIERVSE